MTPQEQKMLDDLIARVDGTALDERDAEAAQRIDDWTRRNPSATYILAQTVLVQNYALEQAKAQIQALQQQAQHAPAPSNKPTSFLGNLFGHREETPRTAIAPQQQYDQTRTAGYTPVPNYGSSQGYAQGSPQGAPQAGWNAPQYAPPATGGGSSFLRSAATTAAGVAAGALAFEGVESLLHGFGHSAGFGGGYGAGEFARPEETVINNYYDTPAPGSSGDAAEIQQFAHEGDGDLSTQQDTADDVSVGNDDEQLQADTDLPTLDDSGSFDDASLDDSGGFDDSSFDS